MILTAKGDKDDVILCRTYFSVGGGFVVEKGETDALASDFTPPFPFNSAVELLEHCKKQDMSIADIIFANELARAKAQDEEATMETVNEQIDAIWEERKAQQIAENERILREQSEMKKLKEREAERVQSELNSTYNKPADSTFSKNNQTFDASTVSDPLNFNPSKYSLYPYPRLVLKATTSLLPGTNFRLLLPRQRTIMVMLP